jgi:hypothetical protein
MISQGMSLVPESHLSEQISDTLERELQLGERQRERLHQLKMYLRREGLEVRLDSDQTLDFIFHGKGRAARIAMRMKEADYLHNHCDFNKGRELAMKTMDPKTSKQQRLAIIRRCVLDQTESKVYPFSRKVAHHPRS